jgi:hypothetical protein
MLSRYWDRPYLFNNTALWPTNRPKELEPLRKQSRTLRGSLADLMFYEIPFTNRNYFESAWPHIFKIKSKGARLILLRGADTKLGRINAGVRIRSPAPERGNLVTPSAPYDTTKARELPVSPRTDIELIVDGDTVDLNRIPLPADTPIIDKRFPRDNVTGAVGSPPKDLVEAKVTGRELGGTVGIQLVDSEGKAVAFAQEGAAHVFIQNAIKKGPLRQGVSGTGAPISSALLLPREAPAQQ